jgi:S-adenosyl-L-methionine hydrolase (adenosine-forming)
LPRPSFQDGVLVAHAVHVDRFGNVQLDGSGAFGLQPGQSVAISVHGESWPGVYGRTFADVPSGELLVYEDSDRLLAVAVNQGSAAARLGISVGDELRISVGDELRIAPE